MRKKVPAPLRQSLIESPRVAARKLLSFQPLPAGLNPPLPDLNDYPPPHSKGIRIPPLQFVRYLIFRYPVGQQPISPLPLALPPIDRCQLRFLQNLAHLAESGWESKAVVLRYFAVHPPEICPDWNWHQRASRAEIHRPWAHRSMSLKLPHVRTM